MSEYDSLSNLGVVKGDTFQALVTLLVEETRPVSQPASAPSSAHLPKQTKKKYTTSPSIEKMSHMTDS